jgi:cobalt/nickel transport system permease protein/cobalt/nickel transport protein
MRTRTFLVVGFLVALLLAGVVSYYASGSPDGLNRVAQDNGFAHTARRHQAAGSPLAGYRTRGVEDGRLSTGLAGVLGAVVVLGLAGGLAFAVRRRVSTGSTGGTGSPGSTDEERG